MKGWTGKILRVDLTKRSSSIEDLDPTTARMFIGGHGVATKILLDENVAEADPLSPDNKLVFSTGPLTGTAAVTSGRYMVTSKSPLTGLLGHANSGGFFGPAMRSAGYDHIIIEGRSDKPVYLWIDDDKVEVREAEHVWGKLTDETEAIIRKEVEGTGKRARVVSIGPAGEKLVKIAAIMNDQHRAAARCGLGAVMGSKNLKAVAVRGSKKVEVADETGLKAAAKNAREILKANPLTGEQIPRLGTPGLLMPYNQAGIVPVRNFQKSSFGQRAENISGEALEEKYLKKRAACSGCSIGCGRVTEVKEPGYEGKGEGPEYETLIMIGANLDIDNLAAITKANYLCNQFGMDTISVGGTIACAMEMFEKGYLTKKETGFDLKFGDAGLLVKLVEMIGRREGFGDALAEGGFRMAEKYGHPELFMGVNKLEMPAYDPRGAKGMGINYLTSPIGASHCRGYTVAMEILGIPEKVEPTAENGKGMVAKAFQDMTAAWDATGICLFPIMGMGADNLVAMLSAAIGVPMVLLDFIKIGERIFNIQRLFNLRAGLKKEDERLPDRFLNEPLPDGELAGATLSLVGAMKEYYSLRGWDENGTPYLGKLKSLGLADYAS
ncbi:MAG: aldehyde ferredoxin oxidoreductase [Deltaproteobacteria bacterium CG1_02_45_11]|nr:MAG: aldehyde ferredoxin oxidoreductase [Deltaproteobacteria bacterium CG1_02_45_11]